MVGDLDDDTAFEALWAKWAGCGAAVVGAAVALDSCSTLSAAGALEAAAEIGGLLLIPFVGIELAGCDEPLLAAFVEVDRVMRDAGRVDFATDLVRFANPCEGGLLAAVALVEARVEGALLVAVAACSVSGLPVNFFGAAGGSGNFERRASAG